MQLAKNDAILRLNFDLFFFFSEGEIACKLFKVDAEKFVSSFLRPKVKVGTEWVNKGQNLEQVLFLQRKFSIFS